MVPEETSCTQTEQQVGAAAWLERADAGCDEAGAAMETGLHIQAEHAGCSWCCHVLAPTCCSSLACRQQKKTGPVLTTDLRATLAQPPSVHATTANRLCLFGTSDFSVPAC